MRLTRKFATAAILLAAIPGPSGLSQQAAESAAAPVRIAAGVTYRHLGRTNAQGEPLSIHVLQISRAEKGVGIRAVSACAAGLQCEMRRELPTKMAADASAAGDHVLAVVNGDYDEGGLGISVGAAVTSGRLWTTRRDVEPALALLRSGVPVIGTPRISIELRRGRDRWQVGALNKPLAGASGPVLYTREFPGSIKHAEGVRAVWISVPAAALPIRVDSTVRGRVVSQFDAMEESPITPGRFVLADKEGAPASAIDALRFGDEVQIEFRARMETPGKVWDQVREVIGGSPIIVRDARRTISGPASASLRQRHPRTAACYNAREILFVVVDGRQPKLSVGMTLEELSDLMIALGCEAAINTDGGGSSVMAVALPEASSPTGSGDGPQGAPPLRIVNSPSDGKERGRGNAWLVVRTKRR